MVARRTPTAAKSNGLSRVRLHGLFSLLLLHSRNGPPRPNRGPTGEGANDLRSMDRPPPPRPLPEPASGPLLLGRWAGGGAGIQLSVNGSVPESVPGAKLLYDAMESQPGMVEEKYDRE